MALSALALAWLVGTYVALLGAFGPGLGGPLLVLGLAALGACFVAWPSPRLRIAALALAALYLASARTLSVEAVLAHDPLEGLKGEVELLGTVASPPEVQGQRTNVVVDVRARLVEGGWQQQDGRVWLSVYSGPSVSYGDAIQVRGRLAEPRSRPGYPLPTLLNRQGIRYLVERPRVTLVEQRSGDPIWQALQGARESISSALRQQLPEPHASLLAGILVGTRTQMPGEFRQALAASGTSHIVAVSGFNIAVVAGLASAMLVRTVGRRYTLLPALVAIALYTLLTGPQPSAVRAALMGGAALIALSTGRLADPVTSLLLAGALMLAVDPLQGLDLGFQLSFAATAGLILLQPAIAARLSPLPRWLRDPLAVTLAAQLATLPIIATTFHTVSLVSPLANLLIAAALPGLMALGGLLVLASPVSTLATVLAWPCWALLSYVVTVIQVSGSLRGALLPLGSPPQSVVVALYALVLLLGLCGLPEVRAILTSLAARSRWRASHLALLAVPLAALLPLSAVVSRPNGLLHAQTIELGRSLALLLRTPSGRTGLLVGPGSPARVAAALPQQLRLGESRLGVVAATSGTELDGLRALLARYPAETALIPVSGQPLQVRSEVGMREISPHASVELDREVRLAPIFAGLPDEQLIGWLVTHGQVRLAVVAHLEGQTPLPSLRVQALALLDDRRPLWALPEIPADAAQLLVLASPSGTQIPLPPLLVSETHGQVRLESDGEALLVRAERCSAPLDPSNCVLRLSD